MKKTLKQDKLMVQILSVLTFIFAVFLIYLFSFLLYKPEKYLPPSQIESMDKTKLEEVFGIIEKRQDIDTQGKPDITKFTFDNKEPFR